MLLEDLGLALGFSVVNDLRGICRTHPRIQKHFAGDILGTGEWRTLHGRANLCLEACCFVFDGSDLIRFALPLLHLEQTTVESREDVLILVVLGLGSLRLLGDSDGFRPAFPVCRLLLGFTLFTDLLIEPSFRNLRFRRLW